MADSVPSYVPTQYRSYVANAAAQTGIPASVVAAQINLESSFNPNAVSSAGAQGIAQFVPGTFAAYGNGSPFNVADAFQAYINYMNDLLKQEGGSVRKALEAYNAGPGNLGAGAGYASTILSRAGSGDVTVTGGVGGGSSSGGSGGNGGSSGSSGSDGGGGGLFSWPGEILGWFTQRYNDSKKIFNFLGNFIPNPLDPNSVARVETNYTRIAAGMIGGVFLVMGIIGLVISSVERN